METDLQGMAILSCAGPPQLIHEQALQLLEFLCKNGSERVIDDARSHLSLLRMLRQFHYIDQNGKDQGVNVRNRSAELVKLLSDVDTIRQERKKARTNKNKYGGVEGGMGLGGGFSSSSRYGGFGSETGGFGAYQGEVYGDGGGFGGQETDYSGTQRRGDQFEEYDEGDDVEPTRPTRATTTTRPAPTTTAKRDPPKPKEPEQDLFDFIDEPPTTTASSSSGLASLGATQSSAAADDDEFDDFQSATTPAAQPAANPLASLVPPPTTSTTTSATQFAAPKPLAPGQAAGLNNIFTTASPAPSASSSIISPSTSTFSPPPVQKPSQPIQPTAYRQTGPNYFTSVPASSGSQPTFSSTASTPLSGGATPSYASSASMASLGKPAPKPASSSGVDAFGSLWSTASTKAGVKNTSAPQKGPDLASMAKAKSQAGIWGAASAASSTPRVGATAPTPTAASNQAKPLGNGLDDLLG
jgi:epsin